MDLDSRASPVRDVVGNFFCHRILVGMRPDQIMQLHTLIKANYMIVVSCFSECNVLLLFLYVIQVFY